MGKAKTARKLADNEAMAVARNIRVSPRKLNLVAGLIRGKPAERAIADLTFSKRRVAGEVRKVLESAVANAENNHQLDVDRLYVAEASVGKSLVMKRFRPRARGRVGRINKPFSRLRVVVREQEETA
jgi:large subunit ribosomal protein L22